MALWGHEIGQNWTYGVISTTHLDHVTLTVEIWGFKIAPSTLWVKYCQTIKVRKKSKIFTWKFFFYCIYKLPLFKSYHLGSWEYSGKVDQKGRNSNDHDTMAGFDNFLSQNKDINVYSCFKKMLAFKAQKSMDDLPRFEIEAKFLL